MPSGAVPPRNLAQVWLPTMPSSSQLLARWNAITACLGGGAELSGRIGAGVAPIGEQPLQFDDPAVDVDVVLVQGRLVSHGGSPSDRGVDPRRYALVVHCAPGARRDEGPFGQPPVHATAPSGRIWVQSAHGVHRHPAGSAGLLHAARGGQLEGVLGGQQGGLPRRGRRHRSQALCDELDEYGPFHLFRPYNDVRFAKGRPPYKTQQGAYGEGEGGAGFYFHISREGLMAAAGYYAMMRDQLERFRDGGRFADHRARRSPASSPACRSATGSARSTSSRRRPRAIPRTTRGSTCCVARV